MLKHILTTAVAVVALCSCSQGSSSHAQSDVVPDSDLPPNLKSGAQQFLGPPVPEDQVGNIKVNGGTAAADAEQQLAEFRLQSECAREARAWFREQRREGGGNGSLGAGRTVNWSLVQYHYSLPEHGCYAVVETLTNLQTSSVSVVADGLSLYRVDGSELGELSVSGGKAGSRDRRTPISIKQCYVGTSTCTRLSEWSDLARPYVGAVDLSYMAGLLNAAGQAAQIGP